MSDGHPYDQGWDVIIEGVPSLRATLGYADPTNREDLAALYSGAAVPAIPEVVAAPPGVLLPNAFAPFRP